MVPGWQRIARVVAMGIVHAQHLDLVADVAAGTDAGGGAALLSVALGHADFRAAFVREIGEPRHLRDQDRQHRRGDMPGVR
ncbi:hypothetical protein A0126_15540 [Exiguobacterium sp. N4-1P]|nr:hypothetical protein A0126_15540 [Exiguobacterium sp. N4-1P]